MAALQRSKGLNKPCVLLIVIAGMERFAYKGVASNLVTYLTDVVKMSNSSAAKMVNTWCGFTSIMPLLVATLADTYWDHYFTILIFSFLYVLGLLALTSTSIVGAFSIHKTISSSSLYWSLYMISLGQGGYNPSLQAFGADQLENEEDDDLPISVSATYKNDNNDTKSSNNNKSMFFQWWYFGICSGSLLGVSLMSYIQDTIGWGLGFAIPTIVMVTSVAFFAFGTRFYAYKEPKDIDYFKPFENVVQTIKRIASKLTNGCASSSKEIEAVELELEEKPLCKENVDDKKPEDENPKIPFNLLEYVRAIARLVPIWAMLLTFAVIFQQPATFFTKQGVTMKRNIGHNFKIPPATLQSAITVSIILLMPLYDRVFIPFTQMITRNEKGISVMQRMGIGMFLSIIAMVIAALVETKRLKIIAENTVFFGSETEELTVPLSIFWLLPQYILLGISDIFTVVGMQEFFYSEVPVRMRTMGIALYTSVFGVGSFFSALLITLVEFFTSGEDGNHGWFSDDMREARLDKYYWLLALLSTLSLMLYMVFCKFYKSRDSLDNEKL